MVLILAFASACDAGPPPPPTIVVDGDTIALPAGARIHDIDVRVQDDAEFSGDRVQARPGDVLRFTTGDGRGHALAFDAAELSDVAATFLEATGQRRGAPLLATGASWIVDLAGAPAGAYRVVCLVHERGIGVDITAR